MCLTLSIYELTSYLSWHLYACNSTASLFDLVHSVKVITVVYTECRLLKVKGAYCCTQPRR
jgi:hypothetical protein